MKKLSLLFLMLASGQTAFGQRQPDSDNLRFGFDLSIGYSNLQVSPVQFVYAKSIEVKNGVGGKLGIMMDYKMNDRLSFSPKMDMAFNSARINIVQSGDIRTTYHVQQAGIEIPLLFNYKISDWNPAPYIILGPCLKLPLASPKNMLSFNSDVSIDFGVGMNNAVAYFIFAPELRYSYGLVNLSGVNEIGILNMHSISLVLNFKD